MSIQTTIHNDAITEKSLYNADFYRWTIHNAQLLRQGRFSEIDVENIAEEIESMGRSERRELLNRLSVLIMHLLKLQYQPRRRSRSWFRTIDTQRMDIALLLEESPSLRHELELVADKAYERAQLLFEKETRINKDILPGTCPYALEQLINDSFLPCGMVPGE
ncbi:DUF29 domain-containing protein [Candidatus Magnetobacterium casense]|uniref:DUF29 domain-containing protein n=1 Tax=Candidatus Magnetobacterium casense TaxID=1455061 RepID=A0ABS6RZT3_9BACT|nr:DUF29 domain-containing protein [Candidatus Magnetobacterium casensis]MBV6342066.1 DUF29 domain-containing protein [Candidatus Magnetobacterium casensis]